MFILIENFSGFMQTKNPQKRTNWIFVGVLIIVFPLILFTLFMTNVLPPYSKGTSTSIDSVRTDSILHKEGKPDSTFNYKNDNQPGR